MEGSVGTVGMGLQRKLLWFVPSPAWCCWEVRKPQREVLGHWGCVFKGKFRHLVSWALLPSSPLLSPSLSSLFLFCMR